MKAINPHIQEPLELPNQIKYKEHLTWAHHCKTAQEHRKQSENIMIHDSQKSEARLIGNLLTKTVEHN